MHHILHMALIRVVYSDGGKLKTYKDFMRIKWRDYKTLRGIACILEKAHTIGETGVYVKKKRGMRNRR